MNLNLSEDKEKAMLADELTLYIKDEHTSEEYTGFIDGFKAAFYILKLYTVNDIIKHCNNCKHLVIKNNNYSICKVQDEYVNNPVDSGCDKFEKL